MNLLKVLGIKSKEEKREEKLQEVLRNFGIERNLPSVMRFRLIAYDENRRQVDDWYLGTRCRNEPEGIYFLKAYGLEKTTERVVFQDEAALLWSRWLNRPIPLMLFGSLEFNLERNTEWFKWSQGNIVDPIAAKQIGDLPSSYTFKVKEESV